MRLSPVLAALLSGLLALATPDPAGPDQLARASVNDGEGADGSAAVVHSLSLSGSSSHKTEKNITLDSPTLLKLECNLNRDSTDMYIINATWKHGESIVSSEGYTDKGTDSGWHTVLKVSVSAAANYSCIFLPSSGANATFHIKGKLFATKESIEGLLPENYGHINKPAPDVHGGGKTLVTYNGDSVDLKCDSFTYTPIEWRWYRAIGNETILVNVSLDPSKYKQTTNKANETKLHIVNLTADDSGGYICKAIFRTGESEGELHLTVLSLMGPLKVFLAIAAEVAILVAVILGYELLSKKKTETKDDVKTETEQMAHLDSEENSISEGSVARQRKV